MDALSAQFCINKRYFHRDKVYSRSRRAIGATGGSLGHRLAQPESADADGDRSPRGDQLIRAGGHIAIFGLKNRARSARSTCARATGVLFLWATFNSCSTSRLDPPASAADFFRNFPLSISGAAIQHLGCHFFRFHGREPFLLVMLHFCRRTPRPPQLEP
jgi:hypothetical protein